MSDDLTAGLAATANEPTADSTPTIDATLDAAFEPSSEPAAGSEPSAQTEPAKEPAAATAQPPAQTQTESQTGEPPKERWDSILANARTKAREEALAEHKNALEIFQEIQRDPGAAIARWFEELAGNDRYSEAMAAKAAALLNARKQKGKAEDEPAPDLQTQDGALVYSADQLRKWQEWNGRQIEKRLGEQFKPLTELRDQVEQSREAQRVTQQAVSLAQKRGEAWKSMPFYEDNKDAILKRQQELYADASKAPGFDAVNGPWELLQRAYGEIVQSHALPKLQATKTEQLVANAAHKRAGSASDPAAAAPAQPRKPRTPDEAIDQVFDAYAGA